MNFLAENVQKYGNNELGIKMKILNLIILTNLPFKAMTIGIQQIYVNF